jgi:hypothetical protein
MKGTPEENMARRKEPPPPVVSTPEKTESLSDVWLKRLKNNPLIAAVIVLGTVAAAVIGFWQKAADVYEQRVEVPVSLAAFNLSETSDLYFEEKPFSCKFDGHNVRTFMPPASIKENRAVSLDFVFSNKSKSDAIFKGVDLNVSAAEQIAGGSPGIVVPNHTYVVNLKHQVGVQPFALTPVYRVPGNETGSFTVVFKPATEGVGLCWIMQAVFHTNLGDVKSENFSLIMSNFKK